jgi:hypothetical protein
MAYISILISSVLVFTLLSIFFVIQHELKVTSTKETVNYFRKSFFRLNQEGLHEESSEISLNDAGEEEQGNMSEEEEIKDNGKTEQRGDLICNGKPTDSEIIYWKKVPGDKQYESPITPHHGEHHDRYLTFEYDGGGWNNVRMGLECVIVLAHAMGRTLVIPPAQHLYLLGLYI